MRVYKDKLYSFWASYASMGMDEEVYRITTPSITSLIRLRQELYPVLPLCQRCQNPCKQYAAPNLLRFTCFEFKEKT